MLTAAKRGLMILNIFSLQKHFVKNIWRRNVYHKANNKASSIFFWIFALFFIQKLFFENLREADDTF